VVRDPRLTRGRQRRHLVDERRVDLPHARERAPVRLKPSVRKRRDGLPQFAVLADEEMLHANRPQKERARRRVHQRRSDHAQLVRRIDRDRKLVLTHRLGVMPPRTRSTR
jgi:hypothetical protein